MVQFDAYHGPKLPDGLSLHFAVPGLYQVLRALVYSSLSSWPGVSPFTRLKASHLTKWLLM